MEQSGLIIVVSLIGTRHWSTLLFLLGPSGYFCSSIFIFNF